MARHLFSIRDLSEGELLELTSRPTEVKGPDRLIGTMSLFLQQASVRTISTFAAAATELGLVPVTLTFGDGELRSQSDFDDEINQLCLCGTRCVVVRSQRPLVQSRYRGSPVPIVNAGDGCNEHPTQALTDLAVLRSIGFDGKTIVFFGNNRDHRTTHSLSRALENFDIKIRFVGPPDLKPADEFLRSKMEWCPVETRAERNEILASADFVYLTPFRYYTLPHYEDRHGLLGLTLVEAETILQPHAKVLHPFPRLGELDSSLDGSIYDGYTLQVRWGAPIRARLLRHLLKD